MKNSTRIVTTFVAVLFVTLASTVCDAQLNQISDAHAGEQHATTTYEPNGWKEFSPPNGGFSILFPGTPQSSTRVFKVNGKPLDKYVFELKDSAEYVVTYLDFTIPEEAADVADTVLNTMANNAVASINAELLSNSEIASDDYPGRLLKAKTPDGGILRAKLVLRGSRLYQITLKTSHEQGAPAEATRLYEESASKFFNSFKVLQPEPPRGGEVERYFTQHPEMILRRRLQGAVSKKEKAAVDGITGGKLVSMSYPHYPPIARAARAMGTVVVYTVVDEEGKVVAAEATSGNPLLREAAVKAARTARFAPTLLDGKVVKVSGTLSFNFNIQ